MPPDITIPDLPKQVEGAATLGEAAIRGDSPFRTNMLLLAREIGFMSATSPGPASLRNRFTLFRRRS